MLAKLRGHIAAVVLFSVGCVMSVGLALYVGKLNYYVNEIRFQNETEEVAKFVRTRLETYINAVVHTKALFVVAPKVSRKNFSDYVENLDVFQKYPGILGIGFIMRVPVTHLKDHLKNVHGEGMAEYKIWPATDHSEVYPIVYYEPQNPDNTRILGFDVGSKPDRLEILQHATETGQPAISKKVTLVRDTKVGRPATPGFLIFNPIYKPDMPTETVEQRRIALMGFINSSFRSEMFFNALLKTTLISPGIEFSVYDGDNPVEEAWMFGAEMSASRSKTFRQIQKVNMAGGTWSMDFWAGPEFVSPWSRAEPYLILLCGLFVSFLLGRLAWLAKLKLISEQRMLSEVRRALGERDDFLSIASHELKTPVTSLKLQLDLAMRSASRDSSSTPEFRRVTEFMNRQVVRIVRLIDELLDTTRIDTGKMKYNFEQMDLTELVSELVDRFKNSDLNLQGHLSLHAKGPVMIEADRFRLEQAIVNLITNAVKYGDGNDIQVMVGQSESGAIIEVKDGGIGIPADKLELIFNRFERVSEDTNIAGLGLGLYITKEIIAAHGGYIRVQSEVGKGSTFTVTLTK